MTSHRKIYYSIVSLLPDSASNGHIDSYPINKFNAIKTATNSIFFCQSIKTGTNLPLTFITILPTEKPEVKGELTRDVLLDNYAAATTEINRHLFVIFNNKNKENKCNIKK